MLDVCLFAHARDRRSHHVSLNSFEDLVNELTPHDIREQKDGPLISGAVFNGPRGKRNVERLTLGLLDFDGLTKSQRDAILEGVDGIEALYYTTFSHAPPAYKFRLIVALSRPVLPHEWPEWWPRFGHFVGQDMMDPYVAKNIACVFYTPSAPPGTTPEHMYLPGEPLDVDALLDFDFPPGYESANETHEADLVEVPEDFDPSARVISYAAGQLAEAAREIEAAPCPGPIYPTLNTRAFSIGRYTPHILAFDKVYQTLVGAAYRRNPNPPGPADKYETIVSKGIEDGQQVPWVPNHSYPLTDSGNARRFAYLHKDRVRWVLDWGKWVAWDGKRWSMLGGGELARANVQAVAEAIKEEAQYAEDHEYAKALESHAYKLQSSAKITNTLTEAKAQPILHARQADFDPDPWLIACPNGVVDLRTGKLRDSRPDDMILSLTGCEYDPDATSQLWQSFLREVTAGDKELELYLQRALGFSLTGSVREHALFFCYGGGINGKGTLLETIGAAFGDYFTSVPEDFLIERIGEKHETELASLYRRRMALSPEQPANKNWNEVKVKKLTGGDTVTARRMREDPWSFRPTHKIWCMGNNLPHVKGLDKGIWRRLHLIPFTEDFSETVDVELPEKLAAHLPAVLTWCVEGAQEWLRQGLDPPQAVLAATEQYREEENPLTEFIAETFRPAEDGFVSRRVMRQKYSQFCHKRQEIDPMGPRQLVRSLRQLGYKEIKRQGVRGFAGLEVAE